MTKCSVPKGFIDLRTKAAVNAHKKDLFKISMSDPTYLHLIMQVYSRVSEQLIDNVPYREF